MAIVNIILISLTTFVYNWGIIFFRPESGFSTTMSDNFDSLLTPEQREILSSLTTPYLIQAFLDTVPYSPEEKDRCPLEVLQDRIAHCLDGGLFAAMALRRIGFPPLIVDLFPDAGMDDDHILAIFKLKGCYGAVAKSNFTGLRYREPVFRSLRELVMSYFEQFYNVDGVLTLRTYTVPLNLAGYDRRNWMTDGAVIHTIADKLTKTRQFRVISPEASGALNPVDPLLYRAGMMVADPAGLYKPNK